MRTGIIVAVYVVGMFLTGGYYYNHRCSEREIANDFCGGNAVIMSPTWPIYWLARVAVEVTK